MIKYIHYYSGLTLAVFVGLHVLNHLMILHSEALHIRFMNAARKIYRQPVVEGLLLLAVAIQIISGITLVIQKWPKMEGGFDVLHIASGLYLSLFLIVHVTAVMMGRYKLKLDTNLYYGAGVMNLWPHKLIFIPYYTLAMLSFFAHVACIHRVKMQDYTSLEIAEQQSIGIVAAGIVVTALIIFKMTRILLPDGFGKK